MCAGFTCCLGGFTICSALNHFFPMTKLLSKTVSIKSLGPKKLGLVNLSSMREWVGPELKIIHLGPRSFAGLHMGRRAGARRRP